MARHLLEAWTAALRAAEAAVEATAAVLPPHEVAEHRRRVREEWQLLQGLL